MFIRGFDIRYCFLWPWLVFDGAGVPLMFVIVLILVILFFAAGSLRLVLRWLADWFVWLLALVCLVLYTRAGGLVCVFAFALLGAYCVLICLRMWLCCVLACLPLAV